MDYSTNWASMELVIAMINIEGDRLPEIIKVRWNLKNPSRIKTKMAAKRDKKISKRGEPLPAIEHLTGGGGCATTAEVMISVPGRCFGSIKEGETFSNISEWKGLVQIPVAQRSLKKKMTSSVALGLL